MSNNTFPSLSLITLVFHNLFNYPPPHTFLLPILYNSTPSTITICNIHSYQVASTEVHNCKFCTFAHCLKSN